MREYIRENLKTIIAITVLFMSTTIFICTNELVAKRLPEISTLEVIEWELSEGQVYEYTGKEIRPEIKSIIFKNEEGEEIKKEGKDISLAQYIDNTEVGSADVEIQLIGYHGNLLMEDVFEIRPATVEKLEIVSSSRENIDLSWKKVNGAEGYLVYKSTDNGANYIPVKEVADGEVTTYQDTNIQLNATYMYYVRAYVYVENIAVFGEASNAITQVTPLETAALVGATGSAYNSITLQWNVVNGAVGYQVYRSLTKDGEYTCIAEVADGTVTSYTDATCECGIEYFYYIKACQALESGNVYGDASEVLSAKPVPNKVSLSGSVSGDQTQVTLSWKQTMGAQGYEIYRSVDNASNFQLVQKIEQADVLSFTDTGLNKDTEYYYKVRAYCVVNGEMITGAYSNTYLKEVVIVYDYSAYSGDVSVITQYAGKVQYVWGGKSSKGWDCSGFTYWVYKNHFGMDIGTTAAVQAARGTTVSKNDRSAWQAGDILVYSEGAGPSHVAIYLGNGKLIHALSEKYDTLIQDVDYYDRWDRATTLISVKRFFN